MQVYEYHLFQYVPDLVRTLEERGHEVTVMTTDPILVERYTDYGERVSAAYFPRLLRAAIGRDNNPFFRSIEWLLAWPWSWMLKRRFDCAVVTRTNRPFLHAAISAIDSVYPQPALSNEEKKYLIQRATPNDPDLHKRLADPAGWQRRLRNLVDLVFGFGFRQARYDRVANLRVAAVGDVMSGYFQQNGMAPGRVYVTGVPAFEMMSARAEDSQAKVRKEYAGGHTGPAILVLPGHLNKGRDTEEFRALITRLNEEIDDCLFVFKLHPSATAIFRDNLSDVIESSGIKACFLPGAGGDEVLGAGIRACDLVLVQSSTVAFIAAQLGRPVAAYHRSSDDLLMNFLKYVDSVLQLTTPNDADLVARLFRERNRLDALTAEQRDTLRQFVEYCDSPVSKIADVVEGVATARTGKASG